MSSARQSSLLVALIAILGCASASTDPKTVAYCAQLGIDMQASCPYNYARKTVSSSSEIYIDDDEALCMCSGQAITHGVDYSVSSDSGVSHQRLIRIKKVALASYDPGQKYASIGNNTNTSTIASTAPVSWRFSIDNLVQSKNCPVAGKRDDLSLIHI